ncbi:MAG TPA: helix-turn-helix transcriptional regulator [Pyrinomonadaceae bacterium]|jgi:transcriptional regulator with XRE-family HTH domain
MSLIESKKVGELLREWRTRRHLSQLHLALDAEISPKHLSFLETGRSQPSREMILRLAEQMKIPLRERNLLLAAGGFAAVFPSRPLDDESLTAARNVIELMLSRLEPNPALAIDRHWTLVSANKAVNFLLSKVGASMLVPPVNVLRLSLHPNGFAPQIINYAEWREHLLEQLNRQIEITADVFLIELAKELKSYPNSKSPKDKFQTSAPDNSRVAVPLRLMTDNGELSFISTTTVFGTPIDVTLSELAIESFFPADAKTAEIMNCSVR